MMSYSFIFCEKKFIVFIFLGIFRFFFLIKYFFKFSDNVYVDIYEKNCVVIWGSDCFCFVEVSFVGYYNDWLVYVYFFL